MTLHRDCGFKDVRKDDNGYYCSACRQRMPEDYETVVRYTLPSEYYDQLAKQTKSGVSSAR